MKRTQTALYIIVLALFGWGCTTAPRHNPSSGITIKEDHTPSFSIPESDYATDTTQSPGHNAARLQGDDDPSPPSITPDSDSSATVSKSGTPSPSSFLATSKKSAQKKQSGTAGPVNPKKKVPASLDEALEYCQVSQEFWQIGELENALEALDRAYALIIEVDSEDNLKLIQEKEDLRFTISKRILEIYASRHIVVNGQHNEIPMIMNNHVQAEVELLTGKERQFFIDSYRRSGRFRPHILDELRKNGLPETLSWLPLIESGFKVHALSKARALGLWQFIASTGYKFGLNRDYYIDERMDPTKATTAAISYLKELHQLFGDWTTVLAAYNCGEGRVLREIRSQNINYLDNFWDLYEKLPRETARYVPRFLAVLHILKDPAQYGFEDLPLDPVPDFETVMVNREVHLESIANAIGIPEEELINLNPELRYNILPKDPYELLIPAGSKDQLLAEIDNLPLASLPKVAFDDTLRKAASVTHRVQRGETLSNIAVSYGTSVARIKAANHLRNSHIAAGKKLKIPLEGAIPAICKTPSSAWASEKSAATSHTVKQGDSLWNIARQFCTTTQKIKALNNLESSDLLIGQVLKIKEPEDNPERKAGNKEVADGKPSVTPQLKDRKKYRVKKGDTLFTIAKKTNMLLEDFLNINRITSKNKIFPGQVLYIE